MTGTFELLETAPDEFRFNLLTEEGAILAVSLPYRSKELAVEAIKAARESASMALITDRTPPTDPRVPASAATSRPWYEPRRATRPGKRLVAGRPKPVPA